MSETSPLSSILSQSKSGIDLKGPEFEERIHNAKGTNSEGGLFLSQTSGALKILLQERKDVHVIYSKEVSGFPEHDSIILLQEFWNIDPKPRYIVFAFAVPPAHQISVVIDNETNELIATDSLKEDQSTNQNLLKIANGAKIGKLVNGNLLSQYKKQLDTWSCGVFTVCNTLHRVSQKYGCEDHVLDVNKYLEGVIVASVKYEKIEERNQAERDERRMQKTNLLEAIERLRDENGHFKNPESSDDLRNVADALQMENWKSIDRKYPDNNSNREDPQDDDIRERDVKVMVEKYEEEHKDDILGIIVLYALMRGGKYKDVIKFHQKAVKSGEMGYISSENMSTPLDKSVNLARVYIFLSRYDRAKEILIETMEKSKNPRTDIYINCLRLLGIVASHLDQESMAESCFKEAVSLLQRLKALDNEQLGLTYMALGNVYRMSEKDGEALLYYEKAKDTFTSNHGSDHVHVAGCLSNIIPILKRQGKLAEALQCCKKAEHIFKQAHGEHSLDVALAVENLGKLYAELHQVELAEKCTLEAKDIYEGIQGPRHPRIGSCFITLGDIYARQGRFDKAREHFEAAEVIFKDIDGEKHSRYADCLCNLGRVCCIEGKHEKAIQYFEDSNRIYMKAHGPMFLGIAENLSNLSNVYTDLRNKTEAINCISRSIDIIEASCGSERFSLAQILTNAVSNCCILGEADKAKEYYLKLKEIYNSDAKSAEKAQQTSLMGCLFKIAAAFQSIGQDSKAIDSHKELKGLCETIFGPYDQRVTKTIVNMGVSYFRMKDYDKAISCFKRAEETLATVEGCHKAVEIAVCCRNIAAAYRVKGNTEEAAVYMMKEKEWTEKSKMMKDSSGFSPITWRCKT